MLATLVKTLYTTSASCIIIFVYRLLLLSESIYISKGCEVVLQTRAHYKESALSLFFSKISVPLPFSYYQPVEQVLVFRVFHASGVRHARVWCSSLAPRLSSLAVLYACMYTTTSRPVSSDLVIIISGRPSFKSWTKH